MNNYPILGPLHQEEDIEDNTQHPHTVTRGTHKNCVQNKAGCMFTFPRNEHHPDKGENLLTSAVNFSCQMTKYRSKPSPLHTPWLYKI